MGQYSTFDYSKSKHIKAMASDLKTFLGENGITVESDVCEKFADLSLDQDYSWIKGYTIGYNDGMNDCKVSMEEDK